MRAPVKLARTLTAAVLAAIPCAPSTAQVEQPLYTVPVEPAPPPDAWQDFCQRHPGDCEPDERNRRVVNLTPEAWDELTSINRRVNNRVKPQTDRAHWGKADKWDYPEDGYGDCEDYALQKRRLLIEAGWPRSALLITVVWTKQNQGHAVLLVRTDKGAFVLDSENPKILHWVKTGYDYVKRQRAVDPNEWVYIDGGSAAPERAPSNTRWFALPLNGLMPMRRRRRWIARPVGTRMPLLAAVKNPSERSADNTSLT
jgi:predicted transglutaminase-like cysteine proteinase